MSLSKTAIRGPLTAEIDSVSSPVRRFLDERFSAGLRDIQRRYREAAPPLAVPPADRREASPGTVGTAADWLLRFLLYPRPSLDLAAKGASVLGTRAGMTGALEEIAGTLGAPLGNAGDGGFTGPAGGNHSDPEYLARACWALALLTEAYRGGPMAAIEGPLSRFLGRCPSAHDLLALASPAVLSQLSAFRRVFETSLMPRISGRRGRWFLGPVFSGSALLNADADLIAARLLLDLKTSAKRPSLGVREIFQLIGYALLDFGDVYQLSEFGIFSARYAYLATWDIGSSLAELAGCPIDLADIRQEFRQLLVAGRSRALPARAGSATAVAGAGLGYQSGARCLAVQVARVCEA